MMVEMRGDSKMSVWLWIAFVAIHGTEIWIVTHGQAKLTVTIKMRPDACDAIMKNNSAKNSEMNLNHSATFYLYIVANFHALRSYQGRRIVSIFDQDFHTQNAIE